MASFKKYSFLLRVLFPSWKFFDRVEESFQLHYRFGADAESMDEWIPFSFLHERSWISLFYNPEGNLKHILATELERFLKEVQETPSENPEKIQSGISYRLLCDWIEYLLPRDFHGFYQFKIMDSQSDLVISSIQEARS